MSKFKDYFSVASKDYQLYRPRYPKELFDYLATLVQKESIIWDSACGSGQASIELAKRFKQVIASDASQNQLNYAIQKDNITYHNWTAENSGLEPQSIDLITVAQALHWFNLNAFYQEVKRVLKRDGYIAVWFYLLCTVDDKIDRVISDLYYHQLDLDWPQERSHIDNAYKDIHFPFRKLKTPQFNMIEKWDIEQFLGYLSTWSAVKKCIRKTGQNPLVETSKQLKLLWKNQEKKQITWPIHLLVGRQFNE